MVTYNTPEDLREIIYMFQRSRAILTAFELGIFTALGDGPGNSAEVASAIHADVRATDRLMNALVVFGLLEKRGSSFFNTAFSSRYLVQGKPDYLQGLGHSAGMWHTWSQLTEAVRVGHTVRTDRDHGEGWRSNFLAAMHERATRQASGVIEKLDLRNVRTMLDVGGGSGAYSIAFARAVPGLKAVVFDQPHMVPITQKYIEESGLAGKIITLSGDYNTDDTGNGYDLVFLSAIIHINSPEQNRALVKKCAGALNPGGQLVIQDHVMDDSRTSPAHGVLFALNMIVATDHGDTYTETEIRSWMTETGLIDLSRVDTYNNAMIIGKKQ